MNRFDLWRTIADENANNRLEPEVREELKRMAKELRRLTIDLQVKPEHIAAKAAAIIGFSGRDVGTFREREMARIAPQMHKIARKRGARPGEADAFVARVMDRSPETVRRFNRQSQKK